MKTLKNMVIYPSFINSLKAIISSVLTLISSKSSGIKTIVGVSTSVSFNSFVLAVQSEICSLSRTTELRSYEGKDLTDPFNVKELDCHV